METNELGYTNVTFNGPNVANYHIYLNPAFQWWDGPCEGKHVHDLDIKSVILHEILHGVGFVSTIGSLKMAIPIKYDLLLVDVHNNTLVDGNTFTGTFGQKVYIDGIRIYNPLEFEEGISLRHVHSNFQVMSGFMSHTHCRQELDASSQHILNKLGYDCTGEHHVSTNVSGTNNVLGIVLVIAVVIIVVFATAFSCNPNKKRKKRVDFKILLKPLLP
jgi:hypothetical protein